MWLAENREIKIWQTILCIPYFVSYIHECVYKHLFSDKSKNGFAFVSKSNKFHFYEYCRMFVCTIRRFFFLFFWKKNRSICRIQRTLFSWFVFVFIAWIRCDGDFLLIFLAFWPKNRLKIPWYSSVKDHVPLPFTGNDGHYFRRNCDSHSFS